MVELMIALACLAGPRPECIDSACLPERRAALASCVASDLDGDGDVDMADVARWAAPPVLIRISGKVVDPDGKPIAGVTITTTP